MISKQEKGSTKPKPIGVGVVVANVVVTLSIGVGVVVAQEPWKELAWYLIFSYSMEAPSTLQCFFSLMWNLNSIHAQATQNL